MGTISSNECNNTMGDKVRLLRPGLKMVNIGMSHCISMNVIFNILLLKLHIIA